MKNTKIVYSQRFYDCQNNHDGDVQTAYPKYSPYSFVGNIERVKTFYFQGALHTKFSCVGGIVKNDDKDALNNTPWNEIETLAFTDIKSWETEEVKCYVKLSKIGRWFNDDGVSDMLLIKFTTFTIHQCPAEQIGCDEFSADARHFSITIDDPKIISEEDFKAKTKTKRRKIT